MTAAQAFCNCKNPIPNDTLDAAKCSTCGKSISPGKYHLFEDEGFEVFDDGDWDYLESTYSPDDKIRKMRLYEE